MVTVPEAVEPEPSKAEGILREAIGGDRRAAVRRILLYAVVVVALWLAQIAPPAALPIGMIALLLLAVTDRVA